MTMIVIVKKIKTGEHGYFRLLRKENLLGIESIVVFADVEKVPSTHKTSHINHVNSFIATHAAVDHPRHFLKTAKQQKRRIEEEHIQRGDEFENDDDEEEEEGVGAGIPEQYPMVDAADLDNGLAMVQRHFEESHKSDHKHKLHLHGHYSSLEGDDDADE